MKHCTTLQHTTTHYKTLHHTATHRNTPQHTCPKSSGSPAQAAKVNHSAHQRCCWFVATHYNTLHHSATRCNTLHHTTPHYTTLHHNTQHCNTPQYTATHLPELERISRSSRKCASYNTSEVLLICLLSGTTICLAPIVVSTSPTPSMSKPVFIKSHTWMSHVTHINESWHWSSRQRDNPFGSCLRHHPIDVSTSPSPSMYKPASIMPYLWMSHVTQINESCHWSSKTLM